jgi:hypothetical protein
VEKVGGGGGKQVTRTGLVRCERVTRLHVPVSKELWLSDEPKRNVHISVTADCDNLKRRAMVHFRYICCTCRPDLDKSGYSDLWWSISSRFFYIHCRIMVHCRYATEIEHRHFCLWCVISIEYVLRFPPGLQFELKLIVNE